MSAEYTEICLENIQTNQEAGEKIREIQTVLTEAVHAVNDHLRELVKCGYYNRVSITFRCRLYETILFFQATIQDLEYTWNQIENEKMTNADFERLATLSSTATNLKRSLHFTWKTDSYPADFAQERLFVLAKVYRECTTMFLVLESMETIVEFLKEYNG